MASYPYEYIPPISGIHTGTLRNVAHPIIKPAIDPYRQGTMIRTPYQLSAFTSFKIRGNISLATTLSGVIQSQNFFNETLVPENLGPSATTSGSHGLLPPAGSGSQVNLDTLGLLGVAVVHKTERRDLGQTEVYADNSPFVEPDNLRVTTHFPSASSSPSTTHVVVITTHPQNLVIPTGFAQIYGSPSFFDGVIEPFDIRRVVDRTSIEMPYVMHSIKANLSIVNPKRENMIMDDKKDLRNSSTRPFLDSVETFGVGSIPSTAVDIPGAFSDADQRLAPYTDTTDREMFYMSGTTAGLDEAMRYQLIDGFVSASTTYRAPRPSDIRKDVVVMRHGFVYSQNDNYSYDSIAFGGLKK